MDEGAESEIGQESLGIAPTTRHTTTAARIDIERMREQARNDGSTEEIQVTRIEARRRYRGNRSLRFKVWNCRPKAASRHSCLSRSSVRGEDVVPEIRIGISRV